MGLIATMAALVLSLLIASANTSYQEQNSELKVLTVDIILLDRSLAFYGPEAKPVRDHLRALVQSAHDRIWSPAGLSPADLGSAEAQDAFNAIGREIRALPAQTPEQETMKNHAAEKGEKMGEARLLMFEQQLGSSISWPFLTVLVFWICVLFLGFGLFARVNATVTVGLFVGALSVAGAIFLILELSEPYRGLMRISDQPLRNALTLIDR